MTTSSAIIDIGSLLDFVGELLVRFHFIWPFTNMFRCKLCQFDHKSMRANLDNNPFNPKKSRLFGRRIVRREADSAPPMF